MAEPKKLYMGPTSTQELINLLKADLAKKQDIIQFTVLPDPVDAVGRCYEYVGPTTMEFTNGHLYHSDGFLWTEVYKSGGRTWQVVLSLPPYSEADFETIYFVYEDGKVKGYIKGPEQMDLITTTNSWELVPSLPAWDSCKSDTIYFLVENGRLNGYVRNDNPSSEEDKWYELGGKVNFNELDNTPVINGINTKNEAEPDSPKEIELVATVQHYEAPSAGHAWEEDTPYMAEPVKARVNEIAFEAFTDEKLEQIYNDVSASMGG